MYQCVYVLQVTARDVAELGTTDGSISFTSNSNLPSLDGKDDKDVDTGRCGSAMPGCCL
jgi:hypothetical protein